MAIEEKGLPESGFLPYLVLSTREDNSAFCRPFFWSQTESGNWTRVEGSILSLQSSRSGQVWGLHSGGDLKVLAGVTVDCPDGEEWLPVRGSSTFIKFACGQECVWAFSEQSGFAFRPRYLSDIYPTGDGWLHVDPPDDVSLSDVCDLTVDSDDACYVLTACGKLHRRINVCPRSPEGDGWNQLPLPSDDGGTSFSGVWKLFGYRSSSTKPLCVAAGKTCVWCVFGGDKSTLWRLHRRQIAKIERSSGTDNSSPSCSSASAEWEKTCAPPDGLRHVFCSSFDGGTLWAVTNAGKLVACPNASIREAAALEWKTISKDGGWRTVTVLNSSPTRQQTKRGRQEKPSSGGSSQSLYPTLSDVLSPQQRDKRRHSSSDGENENSLPSPKKKRMSSQQVDNLKQTIKGNRNNRRKHQQPSGDGEGNNGGSDLPSNLEKRKKPATSFGKNAGCLPMVQLAMPMCRFPVIEDDPLDRRHDIMQEFVYDFSLEERILAAVAEGADEDI